MSGFKKKERLIYRRKKGTSKNKCNLPGKHKKQKNISEIKIVLKRARISPE